MTEDQVLEDREGQVREDREDQVIEDQVIEDQVLRALNDLVTVLSERSPRHAIMAREEVMRAHRAAGGRYSDIVEGEYRPLVIEMIGDYIQDLIEASARLRRAQAAALYAEGMTMEQIAQRFGVTRQRISQLLSGA